MTCDAVAIETPEARAKSINLTGFDSTRDLAS